MPTSVRLPEDIESRLEALALKTGRSKAYYIREAIERHLEDMENVYLAEAAYADFLKSGEKAIPFDEVKRRLGLAD